MCLDNYESPIIFKESFDIVHSAYYLSDRDKMITSEIAPTLTVAKAAFGKSVVKTILMEHLTELAIAEGVSYTPTSCSAIADDIINGYGDFKITEIILAFHMIREGKFRSGDEDKDNRGKFYSSLSTGAICDCLNRFRFDFRNPILQRYEKEKYRLAKQEEEKNTTYATPKERDQIIMASCLQNLSIPSIINNILTQKQMADLQYYVDERKYHLLLRKRVNEFLDKASKAFPQMEEMNVMSIEIDGAKIDFAPLYKAMEFLDNNYPEDKK